MAGLHASLRQTQNKVLSHEEVEHLAQVSSPPQQQQPKHLLEEEKQKEKGLEEA